MNTTNLAAFGLAMATLALPARSCVIILDATMMQSRDRFDELLAELPEESVSSVRRASGTERLELRNGTVVRLASVQSLDRLRGYSVALIALTRDARREAYERRVDLGRHMAPCFAVTAGQVVDL